MSCATARLRTAPDAAGDPAVTTRAKTTAASNAGSFAPDVRAETDVRLPAQDAHQSGVPAPGPVRFDSLDDVAAAGYVVDGWSRWQRGECAEYALALIKENPHLRFGVLGESDLGDGDASEGWSERHCVAHDDDYAYDSAGRHPLPYRGVEGDCDYAELDAAPEDFGYESDPETERAATMHARLWSIVERRPVPFGGLTADDDLPRVDRVRRRP